jgi:hypothetical protein
MLLNEGGLQDQGLSLGFSEDDVKLMDPTDHHFGTRNLMDGRLKIGRKPVAEVLGFADVEDLGRLPFHQINAWRCAGTSGMLQQFGTVMGRIIARMMGWCLIFHSSPL